MTGSLQGIKVLDLSRILGGPLCGQILGDHGADVLKVEPPNIDQKIDVSAPLTITVQGDVKDPAALARELQPHLQRQIEQINQQMSSRNLYDQPHL